LREARWPNGDARARSRPNGRSAVLFDVVPLVLPLCVLFLEPHGAAFPTSVRERAFAGLVGAHPDRQRQQALRIRRAAAGARRRLAELHDLLELVGTIAATVFVERHALSIPHAPSGSDSAAGLRVVPDGVSRGVTRRASRATLVRPRPPRPRGRPASLRNRRPTP